MSDHPESGIATLTDLKAVTGMGDTPMRNAIKRGELPAKKIGGQFVVRWEWINAWLDGKPGFWDTPVPAPAEPKSEPIPMTSRIQRRRAS